MYCYLKKEIEMLNNVKKTLTKLQDKLIAIILHPVYQKNFFCPNLSYNINKPY